MAEEKVMIVRAKKGGPWPEGTEVRISPESYDSKTMEIVEGRAKLAPETASAPEEEGASAKEFEVAEKPKGRGRRGKSESEADDS